MPAANRYPPPASAWYIVSVLFLAYTFSAIDRQILTLLVGPVRADPDAWGGHGVNPGPDNPQMMTKGGDIQRPVQIGRIVEDHMGHGFSLTC